MVAIWHDKLTCSDYTKLLLVDRLFPTSSKVGLVDCGGQEGVDILPVTPALPERISFLAGDLLS
jgi:hypothetical protein